MEKTSRPVGSKEAILDAAADLIRAHGVVGMSIADVIARSGTSAGSIYHHFGNKHGVVLAVARRSLAGSLESAMKLPGEDEVSPAALFRAAIDRVARDEETAELMIQIWAGAAGDRELNDLLMGEVGGLHTAVAIFIGAWCRSHGLAQDAHALAQILVGLVAGYVVQRTVFTSFDEREYVETGVRLLGYPGLVE